MIRIYYVLQVKKEVEKFETHGKELVTQFKQTQDHTHRLLLFLIFLSSQLLFSK